MSEKLRLEWEYEEVTNDLKIVVTHSDASDAPDVKLRYRRSPDLEARTAPKMKAIFEQFMEERQHYKASTKRTYREVFAGHIGRTLGDFSVCELDPHNLAVYRSELACKYSPRTVNKIFSLLKNLIAFGLERGLASGNPVQNLRSLAESAPDIDPFNFEELRYAFAQIRGHYRSFFEVMVYAGARPSELMGLRWKNVDFANGLVHIKVARVKGEEGEPKTRSSRRAIPMFPPARRALERQKNLTGNDENGYVFTSRLMGPLTRHMNTMWKSALQRAGVRHRPLYQLRHTFASLMLAAGETPAYVSRLMGHTTTETLYRHYARWIPNAASEDGKRFKSLLETGV